MNESEMEDVEFKWSNANLLKLLASLKSSIPMEEKICSYHNGLKTVDWDKVAFPPFSPGECKNKWAEIMKKMRKLRSLTELIVEAEDAISDPLHNKKIHPEVPKKPRQARNAFFVDHYSEFKKKNPGLPPQKIFKLLYNKYDELSDQNKAKYEEKYSSDMIEYKKKMMDFGKQNEIDVREVRITCPFKQNKGGSEDDNDNMPAKPPYNSYNLFCMEHSKSAEGKSSFEATKSLSQRWQDLSKTERDVYAVRLQELRREYVRKLLEYLSGLDEEERQQIIKKKGLKVPKKNKVGKSVSKKRRLDEPKMPAQAAYAYFTAEQVVLLKDKISNSRDRFKMIKNLWLQLPMKKKERYTSKVHENLRRYSAELKMWFKTLDPEEQKNYLKENPSKSKFILEKMWKYDKKELQLCEPSDSEDEEIDVSNSEEEAFSHDDDDDDEEEDDEDIAFDIY